MTAVNTEAPSYFYPVFELSSLFLPPTINIHLRRGISLNIKYHSRDVFPEERALYL